MLAKIPELSKLHDRGGSAESRLINCPPFAIFGRVGSPLPIPVLVSAFLRRGRTRPCLQLKPAKEISGDLPESTVAIRADSATLPRLFAGAGGL